MTEIRRGRVLAIDDDRVATDVIVKALLDRGVDVSVVASPDRGVEKAAEVRPDLVFVSLFFPDSNGLKLSKRIHAVEGLEKVPVVMLISYKGELDPKYTSTIGIVDVLVKPLNAGDVLDKTIKVLGKDVLTEETGAEAGTEDAPPVRPLQDGPVFDDAPAPASLRDEPGGPHLDAWPDDIPVRAERDVTTGPEESEEFLKEHLVKETPAPAEETPLDEETSQRFAGRGEGESVMPFSFDDEIASGEEPRKFLPGRRLLVIAAVCAVLVIGIGAYGLKKVLSKAGKSAQSRQELPAKEVVTEPTGGAVVPAKGAGRAAAGESPAKADDTAAGKKKEPSEAGKERAVSPVPPKRPEERGSQAAAPVVPKGYGYSVQIGAFGSEKNAASLVEKLKKNGYEAFIEQGSGKPAWRVLVGRFANAKPALVQAKALQEDGFKTLLRRSGG